MPRRMSASAPQDPGRPPTAPAMSDAVTLIAICNVPLIRPGDDLAGQLIAACQQGAIAPADGDVLVVAQKIVSKAEGRHVDLAKIQPSPRAARLAAEVDKDPRLV